MKTAMQELIDELKVIQSYSMMSRAISIANKLLEKEKEQIIHAFKAGMDYAEFSVPPNWNNEWNEYYNQTYNQDKECQHNVSRVKGNKQECLKCGKIIL